MLVTSNTTKGSFTVIGLGEQYNRVYPSCVLAWLDLADVVSSCLRVRVWQLGACQVLNSEVLFSTGLSVTEPHIDRPVHDRTSEIAGIRQDSPYGGCHRCLSERNSSI